MPAVTPNTEIPYVARKLISRYSPAVRIRIRELLQQKRDYRGHPNLTWDDLHEAIDVAFGELTEAGSYSPTPNPRMVRLSLAAFRRGDYMTSEDLLNGIRTRMA